MREFLRGCPKKQGIFQTKGAGICQPSLYTLGPLMGEMRIEHLQLLKTMNCSYAPPYRFYNFIIFNQTLAGMTVAQRAVDEALDLDIHLLMDRPDLL